MADTFAEVELALTTLRECGYGDHRLLGTHAWIESDDQKIHMRIGCADCGSRAEHAWPLHGLGQPLNPKEAVRVMILRFTTNTPDSCMEAWKLNVVRRVMLS